MPGGLDGLQLAQHIRDSPASNMCVVALTGASARGSDREEALDAGFDAFLLKPVAKQVVNALLIDLPRERRRKGRDGMGQA